MSKDYKLVKLNILFCANQIIILETLFILMIYNILLF